MKKLIINRKRWIRGGDLFSVLRNENGEMCCLGFEAMREGVKVKDILSRFSPSNTSKKIKTALSKKGILVDSDLNNSQFSCDAINLNDDQTLKESVRERKLIKLFASKDIELTFIN